MGRHTKAEILRVGPKLWARFLRRHFACPDLAPLNAQLLSPPVPFERFEYGVYPEPLPRRLTPKVFERVHNLGRDPDGAYAAELHNAEIKFNLYERVTQRVPESKYWLLKEIAPFLCEQVPSIDTTADTVRVLLDDLGLTMLERKAIAAWKSLSPDSLPEAEDAVINAVFLKAHLPEYVALGLSLTHLAVWCDPPTLQPGLSSRLLQLSSIFTVDSFVSTLDTLKFDLPKLDSIRLGIALERGIKAIGRLGPRSMSNKKDFSPPALGDHLVLVPATETARHAIDCLSRATRLQMHAYQPWRDDWDDVAEDLRTSSAMPHWMEPREAICVLQDAAAAVPPKLATRASTLLSGYQAPSYSRSSRRTERA